MKNTHCVQCHRKMEHAYGGAYFKAPFCNFPDCPNYGLLQTGFFPEEGENSPQEINVV